MSSAEVRRSFDARDLGSGTNLVEHHIPKPSETRHYGCGNRVVAGSSSASLQGSTSVAALLGSCTPLGSIVMAFGGTLSSRRRALLLCCLCPLALRMRHDRPLGHPVTRHGTDPACKLAAIAASYGDRRGLGVVRLEGGGDLAGDVDHQGAGGFKCASL